MTEEQAKTKWCPMVRGAHSINRTSDGVSPYHHMQTCIGSDCMMMALGLKLVKHGSAGEGFDQCDFWLCERP